MLKIVLFAAIPSANEITTTATNPGLFANPRVAIRTSPKTVPDSAPAFIQDLLHVSPDSLYRRSWRQVVFHFFSLASGSEPKRRASLFVSQSQDRDGRRGGRELMKVP